MVKKNIDKIIFIILAIICITLFSTTTSPLYPMNYSEMNNSISVSNLLIGKGISMNYIPYKDLFGYNGPLLYAIESIGYFIGINEIFVYIIQIIMLSFSLIYLNKIMNMFTTKKKSMILSIIALFPLMAALSGGNSADEFCLLPIIISLYVSIKAIREDKIGNKVFVIIGICFAIVFYIRWIQSISVLVMMLYMIIHKKEKYIISVGYSLISIALLSIVIIAYFTYNNALSDMIYGTFIFAFKTLLSGSSTSNEIIRKVIKIIPALLLGFSILYYYKGKERNIIVLFAFTSALCLLFERGYWYYYIVLCFHIPLTLSIINFDKKLFNVVYIFILIGIFIIPMKDSILNMLDRTYQIDNEIKQSWYDENANDSETMLVIDGGSSFYMINDIIPAQRFFTLQTDLALIDMDISEELIEYTENSEDQWMIVGSSGWVYEEYGNYTLISMISDGDGNLLYIYEILEDGEE